MGASRTLPELKNYNVTGQDWLLHPDQKILADIRIKLAMNVLPGLDLYIHSLTIVND